jgi:hypothetical protein
MSMESVCVIDSDLENTSFLIQLGIVQGMSTIGKVLAEINLKFSASRA